MLHVKKKQKLKYFILKTFATEFEIYLFCEELTNKRRRRRRRY